jgi:antimicrobial peptide system SdpB family protein
VPSGELEVGRWVAVAILLVVASGWRPRVTGVLHWWVANSLNVTATMVDGGDQVTSVLTFLMLPLTLTDSRRWHWQPASKKVPEGREEIARIVALSAVMMLRLQMAGIYFHAAVGKFKAEEWADGTAVYYWFTHPTHGMGNWLSSIVTPMLTNPYGVVVLTWGTLVLELLLFMGLVVEKKHRWKLLWLGIFFHAGIAVVHGLISFVLAMWAGLILFLRPMGEEFRVPAWASAAAAWFARLRSTTQTEPLAPHYEPMPALTTADEAGPTKTTR